MYYVIEDYSELNEHKQIFVVYTNAAPDLIDRCVANNSHIGYTRVVCRCENLIIGGGRVVSLLEFLVQSYARIKDKALFDVALAEFGVK